MPGEGGARRAARGEQVRHHRADDQWAFTQVRRKGGRHLKVVGDWSKDADHPLTVNRNEQFAAGAPRGAVEDVEDGTRPLRRGAAHDHGDRADVPPPQGSGPRLHGLVGLATDDRIHDQRLQACVPGTPGLRGLGVDLGGREGDFTAIPQHGLSGKVGFLRTGEVGDLALDDADHRPDQVEGLSQGDRARELAGGGAKDVGEDGGCYPGVGRRRKPVDEGANTSLGHQPDP